MINTILFDLDDTLIGNRMERFLPRYFSLLGAYARPLFADQQLLLQELMAGTQAMVQNTDPSLTNRDVFWQQFCERTGLDMAEAEPFFDRFYDLEFPQLEPVTEAHPLAARVIEACSEQGLQVVIATNPLFPRRAIEHRLAWAGVPVERHNFALVTSYDNMHAAKPQPAYYREILEQVGARPETALMVGDNWENDVLPAIHLGLRVFWIAPPDAVWPTEQPNTKLIVGQGSLDDFYQWFQEGGSGLFQ